MPSRYASIIWQRMMLWQDTYRPQRHVHTVPVLARFPRAGPLSALPGELLADAEHAGVGVHVAPAQPERLADAKPGVGEELEQRPVDAGVVEQPPELVRFEIGRASCRERV